MVLAQNDNLIHFLNINFFRFLSNPFNCTEVFAALGLIINKYVNFLRLFGCRLSPVSSG
jgi:hypothetical protein